MREQFRKDKEKGFLGSDSKILRCEVYNNNNIFRNQNLFSSSDLIYALLYIVYLVEYRVWSVEYVGVSEGFCVQDEGFEKRVKYKGPISVDEMFNQEGRS